MRIGHLSISSETVWKFNDGGNVVTVKVGDYITKWQQYDGYKGVYGQVTGISDNHLSMRRIRRKCEEHSTLIYWNIGLNTDDVDRIEVGRQE